MGRPTRGVGSNPLPEAAVQRGKHSRKEKQEAGGVSSRLTICRKVWKLGTFSPTTRRVGRIDHLFLVYEEWVLIFSWVPPASTTCIITFPARCYSASPCTCVIGSLVLNEERKKIAALQLTIRWNRKSNMGGNMRGGWQFGRTRVPDASIYCDPFLRRLFSLDFYIWIPVFKTVACSLE